MDTDSAPDTPDSTSDLVPEDSVPLDHYEDRLRHYVDQSKSERTKNEYESDWRSWAGWCAEEGVSPLPAQPVSVACYCAAQADRDLALTTIRRRLVTIRQAHQRSNHPDPTRTAKVKAVLDGIRRDPSVNAGGEEAKDALRTQQVLRLLDVIEQMDNRPKAKRDKAILLIGFSAGLRRSELAGLKRSDLKFQHPGLLIEVQRSKSDQEGKGQEVSIHRSEHEDTCPVFAVEQWIDIASIQDDDFLFQTVDRWENVRSGGIRGRAIAEMVKDLVEEAGYDPSQYSAHSLRAGLVTELKSRGEGDSAIMEQTRHSSQETLRRYDKSAARFRRNFTAALGL